MKVSRLATLNRLRFVVRIVDHRMPGMNGRELVAALHRTGFGGHVLIVSVAFTAADISAYRALGVEEQFLMKPITTDTLRTAVGTAVRLHS